MASSDDQPKPQADKFRDLARELECDEDEEAFKEKLRKVATACADYGVRKQFSVFLCRLSATDRVRLKSGLYDLISLQEDQVLFIPLCQPCAGQIEALGRPTRGMS